MTHRPPTPPPDIAGVSLVEVALSTLLLGAIAVITAAALGGLDSSRKHQRDTARITEVIDEIARTIQQEAATAEIVFTDDALGRGYLSVLELPERVIPNTSRLPHLTNRGYFVPDGPTSPETGNLLLLACSGSQLGVQLPGATAANEGGGAGEGGEGGYNPAPMGETTAGNRTRLVGTYVFVLWFVTPNDTGGLDLARWSSVTLANHQDIESIQDLQDRSDAVAELYRTGVRFAWDPDLSVGNGLFRVNDGWTGPAMSSDRVAGNLDTTSLRLLQSRRVQVARNGTMGSIPVPKYGRPDPGGNFPAGFEVKLDGPGNGKMLLLRLALQATRFSHKGVEQAAEKGRGPRGVAERLIHCPRAR